MRARYVVAAVAMIVVAAVVVVWRVEVFNLVAWWWLFRDRGPGL